VDLLVQSASGWILTEVKSGSTVDGSFFQGMEDLAERLKDTQPIERRLIYGGNSSYQRQGAQVVAWAEIQNRPW
jgi:hypothetical protein